MREVGRRCVQQGGGWRCERGGLVLRLCAGLLVHCGVRLTACGAHMHFNSGANSGTDSSADCSADRHGERWRSQLLFELGGPEIVLILAVNILAVNIWLLIFGC